jgi:hypothetical protein
MKRINFFFLVLVILALMSMLGTLNVFAADVAQGKCLEYNQAKKELTIQEYNTEFSKEMPYGKPTIAVSKFDVSDAKIGADPQPGDILRIAYKANGKAKKALKVMNVSKQDLRKK